MPATNRKLRVFLCHSSQDKLIVRELYQRLNAEGWIDPWLDEEKLLPGQDWDMEIEKAVEASDAVIVCVSTSSVKKEGYIQKELRFALNVALEKPEETIFIIPLRIDDCFVPRSIRSIHYIDYFPNEDKTFAYNRIKDSLLIRTKALGLDSIPESKSTQVIPKYILEDKLTENGHRVYIFGGIEFVKVPAGKFILGSKEDNNDALDCEKPQSLFNIPYDYWIGRFPVTNRDYSLFINARGDFFEMPVGKHYHPVVGLSLLSIYSYLTWLNEIKQDQLPQGFAFRLPTEAEWEKSARGIDGRIYPWGNKFDQGRCNTFENGKYSTTPIGEYSPQGDSPYGAMDMAGNVWEWTRSVFTGYPYDIESGRDWKEAALAVLSNSVAVRGGSFFTSAQLSRCAYRLQGFPINWVGCDGFRIAITPIN